MKHSELLITLAAGMVYGIAFSDLISDYNFKNIDTKISIYTIALTTIGLIIAINNLISDQRFKKWEVRKEPLIKISKELAILIQQNEKDLEAAHKEAAGIYDEVKEENNWDQTIYKNFDESIRFFKKFYYPLYEKKFIESITSYETKNNLISDEYENNELNIIQALQALEIEQNKLMEVFSSELKKLVQ